jgi:hypothetical protein
MRDKGKARWSSRVKPQVKPQPPQVKRAPQPEQLRLPLPEYPEMPLTPPVNPRNPDREESPRGVAWIQL